MLMMLLSMAFGFRQVIVVVHFELHQQAIEKAFCINTDKPGMLCHGRCYLKKQLDARGDSETTSRETYQKSDMLFVVASDLQAQHPVIHMREIDHFYQQLSYPGVYAEPWVPPPILHINML